MQKKSLLLVLVVCIGLASLGCQSMGEQAKTGSIIGGVVGAGAGGIIGHQSGHGLEGAAIGAAVGALSGGLIGNQLDKKARETNPNHLSIQAIVDMAKKGIPDDVIIDEIRSTKSVYRLTSEVIGYLKDNQVSNKVIDYMLSTQRPAK